MTERASRDNLFAASAELLFGAGRVVGISEADSLEDSEWQSIGTGFNPAEDPLSLVASAGSPSEDEAQGALGLVDLSDRGILDEDASDSSEAEDGEELIHPLQAEALEISVDVEADTEEAAPLEEETDSDDEDFGNLDDDDVAFSADVLDEEADGSDPESDEPEVKNIIGTDDDDVIVGNVLNNMLLGLGGNDHLDGGAGDDTIVGYGGNDTLFGGNGNDNFSAGEDADKIYGGDGADDLSGNEGDDTLFGGHGDDIIEGGSENDTLYGGEGDDLFLWRRGDGDDLVIEEGRSGSNMLELRGVTCDQVQFKELENGAWQLIIAASAPYANDGGLITFQAGSFETFAQLQFFNPVPSEEYGACG